MDLNLIVEPIIEDIIVPISIDNTGLLLDIDIIDTSIDIGVDLNDTQLSIDVFVDNDLSPADVIIGGTDLSIDVTVDGTEFLVDVYVGGQKGDPGDTLWEFYNGELEEVTPIFGKLYNWYAVIDTRSIAPIGWRVPTHAEWISLATIDNDLNTIAIKLKSNNPLYWDHVDGITNEYLFNSIGAGQYVNWDYNSIKQTSIFWSSSEFGNIEGSAIALYMKDHGDYLENVYLPKESGLSIRLIKDNSMLGGDITDLDGNVYHQVKIGEQVWLQENWNCTKYINGDLIGTNFSENKGAFTTYKYSTSTDSNHIKPNNDRRIYASIIDGLPEYIPQIQSDYNQTNSASLDYIKNKPVIPILSGYATELFVTDITDQKEDKGVAEGLIIGLGLGTVITHNYDEFALALSSDDNYITDLEKVNLHAPHSDDQDLSNLVVKVNGKSLVSDTEIAKIHSLHDDDQDLTPYELLSNKIISRPGAPANNQYPSVPYMLEEIALLNRQDTMLIREQAEFVSSSEYDGDVNGYHVVLNLSKPPISSDGVLSYYNEVGQDYSSVVRTISISGNVLTIISNYYIDSTNFLGVKYFTQIPNLAMSYKEDKSNKGINNGYAPLDSGAKIPLANLPSTLLKYIGNWDVTTNSPILVSPDLTKVSNVYNVVGSGSIFGITFKPGDWLIYNSLGIPEKSDNSDDVVSVNGQTGVVVLTKSDIGLSNVPNISFSGSNTGDNAVNSLYSSLIGFPGYSISQPLTNGINTGSVGTSLLVSRQDHVHPIAVADSITMGLLSKFDWNTFNNKVSFPGSGLTSNYVSKWNAGLLVNSIVQDNGTGVGIGMVPTAPYKLAVAGNGYYSGGLKTIGTLEANGGISTIGNITATGVVQATSFYIFGEALGSGRFLMADGTTQTIGPKGDKGDQGIQGIQGIQGSIGLTGNTGVKGDKGDTGLTGSQGIQGIKGDIGSQGIQGVKGDQGIQGVSGTANINGTGFIKASGTTISYDDNTYVTSSQSTQQTIGSSASRLGKLWGSDIDTLGIAVDGVKGINLYRSGYHSYQNGIDVNGYFIYDSTLGYVMTINSSGTANFSNTPTIAGVSLDSKYIQNNPSSAQVGNIWVDNIIRTNNFFRVGENATMFLGVGGAISGGYSLTDFILYNTGGDAYLLASGAKGLKISADTGSATFASTVQTTGITPTNLSTGYIPMKSSGVLVDSPISIDGNSTHINFNGSTTSRRLQLTTSSGNDNGQLLLGQYNSSSYWVLGRENIEYGNFVLISAASDGIEHLRLAVNQNTGNVGIGYSSGTEITNNRLAVNGSGYFNGTVTATNFILSSDARLKTNIKPISAEHLDLKYYEYELKSNPGEKRYGVIAQDLLKDHPELVSGSEKDMYGVNYVDLLVRKVAELEYRLKEMEDKYVSTKY